MIIKTSMYVNLAACVPEVYLCFSIAIFLLHVTFLNVHWFLLYNGSPRMKSSYRKVFCIDVGSLSYSSTIGIVRLTSVILFFTMLLVINNPISNQTLWGSMFIIDTISTWAKCIILIGLIFVIVEKELYVFFSRFRVYEFIIFILGLALSLCVLVFSFDLFSVYVSMVFLSFIFYLLYALRRELYPYDYDDVAYYGFTVVWNLFFFIGTLSIYSELGSINLVDLSYFVRESIFVPSGIIWGIMYLLISFLVFAECVRSNIWVNFISELSPKKAELIFNIGYFAFFIISFKLVFAVSWVFA